MAIYKKTVRVGKFAKAGEDFKDRDIITILNQGEMVEGDFGVSPVFKIRTPGGEERGLRFNKTSINNMIDAWGEDAGNWVGKQVKVWLILQSVSGKMRKVAYVSHPDADIDDDGNFSLPANLGGHKGEVVDDVDFGLTAEDVGF